MKRVTYKKQDDGSLQTKPLAAERDMVTAVVVGLNWRIVGSTGNIINFGESKNAAQLKKEVKQALVAQGVDFLDEVRDRSKKVDSSTEEEKAS